jgi:hypothetical protein
MTADAFCIQKDRVDGVSVSASRGRGEGEDIQADIFAFEADALKVVIGNFVWNLKTDKEGLNQR